MQWLNHESLNLSYVAALLYGSKSTSNTTKLYHRMHGRTQFTDAEKIRLEQIRKDLIKALKS